MRILGSQSGSASDSYGRTTGSAPKVYLEAEVGVPPVVSYPAILADRGPW
jgi:hypothetical protein